MKLKLDHTRFDDINPFILDPLERIKELDEKSTEDEIYAVFIRNYCCYLFDKQTDTTEFIEEITKPSILHKYLSALAIVDNYLSVKVKFMDFRWFELKTFKPLKSNPIASKYYDFLNNYLIIFLNLDAYIKSYEAAINENKFSDFLKLKNVNIENVDIIAVDNKFIEIYKSFFTSLFENFLKDTNLYNIDLFIVEAKLKSFQFYFNSRLFSEHQKEELRFYGILWFENMLDSISHDICETQWIPPFHKLHKHFIDLFPVSKSKEPTYPTTIFSNYKAYLLFDTVAKGISTHKSISYLYRMMYEKELVTVNDTPFRAWFNEQSYEIKLNSHTDTLINSHSTDREQLIKVIANILEVPL